jgi:phosphoribosyl-ATP pyrophosphohydrolase/phosphoribosyl-AMP cyclohydrolase
MLVPSIDLEAGSAVQLIGGEAKALDAGDPRPLARRFGRVGEIAVVDLDAALGRGSNAALIEELIDLARCRVGGGIRDVAAAIRWLDRGARQVVLGTAARPEILAKLPRERVVAALDARDGEVVVEGWRKRTGERVLERIAALRDLVGSFLVTFVEREGRLQGTDLAFARQIRDAAGMAAVTIAGGISSVEEVRELDRLGCDAQVGMALYTGRLGLAEAFVAPLTSDRPDGLWPTVVVDERGTALGLCFSNLESLIAALEQGRGVYHSRSRGLWVKGETSGATQELLGIDADCDRDALRFTVRQEPPGFCHLNTRTCWGADRGLGALARRLAERKAAAPADSYTARLFADPELLGAKLREEAAELAEATSRENAVHEAADVFYFTLSTLARHGIDLAEVEAALDRRALKVTRRA